MDYEDDLRLQRLMADACRRNDEFRRQWPAHCRACGGWGGHADFGTYDSPPDYYVCEAIGPEFCHRCGYEGYSSDHDGLGLAETFAIRPQVGCWWCGHSDEDGIVD
jgi:hypothetical protein